MSMVSGGHNNRHGENEKSRGGSGGREREEIIKVYAEIKDKIEQKFFEFRRRGKERDKVLEELVFCLLTPQSKAEVCWRATEGIISDKKISASSQRLLPYLSGIRFRKKKSQYIEAGVQRIIGEWAEFSRCLKEENKAREWLVKKIKGMGYKEASHFLRNIGHGENLAILDRHILKSLEGFGIKGDVKTKSGYLDLEEKMRDFSMSLGIPLSHLDFVLWYMETGRIFK